MLAHPMAVTVALSGHIINATLQALSSNKADEDHNRSTAQTHDSSPICLGDAGWCDHYGRRRGDVDVERL